MAAPKSTSQKTPPGAASGRPLVPEISPELQRVLQHIVDDVVVRLGCVGAMVATLEGDNALPVRAYAIDFPQEFLNQVEGQLGFGLLSAQAVTYLDDEHYQENLSIRAVLNVNNRPDTHLISDHLYDLLRPVVAPEVAAYAQQAIGISQVVAVPFFLDDEVVGNLFAAARQPFSDRDIDFLVAFGHQAATAIQSQRQLAETQALQRVIFDLQASMVDETQALQTVVDAVVDKLGYAGAMVATLEANNALPVRAFAKDFDSALLRQLEDRLGISPVSPRSVVYLDDARYKDNLSVLAVRGPGGRPADYLVSDRLYDLFRPIINRPLSDVAQRLVGIKQVIAVPFFLEDEVVGNLFVATRKATFSTREIAILTAFGQQAAMGIRNARLYQKAEERRQIAQMFARMAFSAAASVHALRNHVGAFRTYLGLIQMTSNMSEERRQRVFASADEVLERLHEAAGILDTLHRPWQQRPDVPTDVNNCLAWAIREVLPGVQPDIPGGESQTKDGLTLHHAFAAGLPAVETSPDMLTEAFQVLVKNAVEALRENRKGSDLWVESRLTETGDIQVTIRDNGGGIKAQNLSKIFEMGWSTKRGEGMGFGLFWTRDYIEGLGGAIRVESKWKQGTTFYLLLPASSESNPGYSSNLTAGE